MEPPFVNEDHGVEQISGLSGRTYDVVLIPEDDDNGTASQGDPDDLSLSIRCQFLEAIPGVEEPLFLAYNNETFPLPRPISTGDLSGVTMWLISTAGVPAAAITSTLRIVGEFYNHYPTARNSMAVIRVTTTVNYNFVGGNYLAGGEADLEAALRHSEEASEWERAVPASKAAVAALEKVEIRVSEETKESQCVVCIREFSSGEEAVKMPCEHVFHGDCIGKWLEYRPFCPTCRFELPLEETS